MFVRESVCVFENLLPIFTCRLDRPPIRCLGGTSADKQPVDQTCEAEEVIVALVLPQEHEALDKIVHAVEKTEVRGTGSQMTPKQCDMHV